MNSRTAASAQRLRASLAAREHGISFPRASMAIVPLMGNYADPVARYASWLSSCLMVSEDGELFGLSSRTSFAAAQRTIGDNMMRRDENRKWMLWLLAVGLLAQSYFFRELFAVFALFTLGFVAVAFSVFCLYMGKVALDLGITWSAVSIKSLVLVAPSGRAFDESSGGRPERDRLPPACGVAPFLLRPENPDSGGSL